MDISRLEKLICEASARMTLAQQRSLPTLDRCIPGMVGPMERERFKIHHRAIVMAYNDAITASTALLEAAKMLGKLTEEPNV